LLQLWTRFPHYYHALFTLTSFATTVEKICNWNNHFQYHYLCQPIELNYPLLIQIKNEILHSSGRPRGGIVRIAIQRVPGVGVHHSLTRYSTTVLGNN